MVETSNTELGKLLNKEIGGLLVENLLSKEVIARLIALKSVTDSEKAEQSYHDFLLELLNKELEELDTDKLASASFIHSKAMDLLNHNNR